MNNTDTGIGQKRAAKGGEQGVNGEFYEGGKFLPNTERAKGKPNKRTSTRKECVAPYVWEVAPAEGMRPILSALFTMNIHTGEVVWAACEMYRVDVPRMLKMYAAWKSGIRWYQAA